MSSLFKDWAVDQAIDNAMVKAENLKAQGTILDDDEIELEEEAKMILELETTRKQLQIQTKRCENLEAEKKDNTKKRMTAQRSLRQLRYLRKEKDSAEKKISKMQEKIERLEKLEKLQNNV